LMPFINEKREPSPVKAGEGFFSLVLPGGHVRSIG